MGERCENCRFFKHELPGDVGQCRRRPPFGLVGANLVSVFPRVSAQDWCGEWRDRNAAPGDGLRHPLDDWE